MLQEAPLLPQAAKTIKLSAFTFVTQAKSVQDYHTGESFPFMHWRQVHLTEQFTPYSKHSQYFFWHLEFLHLHPADKTGKRCQWPKYGQ